MTKSEWFSSDDPAALLRHLTHQGNSHFGETPREVPLVSDRKLRLFACACCHLSASHPSPDEAFEVSKTPGQVLAVCWAQEWAQPSASGPSQGVKGALLRSLVGNPFRPVTLDPAWLTPDVVSLATAAYEERARPCEKCKGTGKSWNYRFKHPAYCSACERTGTIDDGTLDPARLAVLSDALEEAGCDSTVILDHLRSPGPHVRGCWALDLILRKE